MVPSRLFTSSRLFLYFGIALVVLAVTAFPTRVVLHAQAADGDYYGVGWLFAPIIGIWGLAGVFLGLAQSPMPKKRIEGYLLPLFIVVCVGLAYATHMVFMFGTGIVVSAGHGEPFWWIYFAMTLAPSALIFGVTAMFHEAKPKLDSILEKKKIKMGLFAAVSAAPLIYSIALLLFLRLL
jgi:hypothetical protein